MGSNLLGKRRKETLMNISDFLTTMVQGIALGIGVGAGTAIGTYFATKHFLATFEKIAKKLKEARE